MTKEGRKTNQAAPSDRGATPVAPDGHASALGLIIERHRTLLALAAGTVLLKSLIFAPISVWPLTFVCLVPWLILVGCAARAPRVYFHSYLMGLVFFLINMRWLYDATGWGYLALSVYLAAYFPLMACPVRSVIRRRHWPLAVVLPFVWVGGELLRAVVMSGFPWFYLSHGLHRVLTLIQISDLVGAYGVSFVAAAVNGALADALIARYAAAPAPSSRSRPLTAPPAGRRRPKFGTAYAAFLLLASIIYGQVQLHRGTASEGPKIAVIQGDYINSVEGDEISDAEKQRNYRSMIEVAAKEHPDLIMLPESPWRMFLNPEARDFFRESRQSFSMLHGLARKEQVYLVTGSASMVAKPDDLFAKERWYNSATVFHPDGREPGRYDKIHLVYFGEVVPFRFGKLRFLYFWLNRLMPFSGPDGDTEYSLFRGDEFRVFTMRPRTPAERDFRFGIPICYEDVMPYVSREFVAGGHNKKRVDFLLNISNDGWFGRGIQQPQHLAICAFRAVENRVGIARAVNTGVSGFIDPTGRLHDLVENRGESPWGGNSGIAVARVGVDSRFTLYSRFGDWFAWLCAFCWLVFFVDYWIVRARSASA